VVVLALCLSAEAGAQQLLFRFDGTRAEQGLGGAVLGAGDLNRDGVPDIAVGAPIDDFAIGTAFVYSGAKGTTLYQVYPLELRGYFGAALASAGDLDGDGVPDLIVGAPFTSRPEEAFGVGSVLVFSGATGKLLFNFVGGEAGTYMGWSVAGVGDLDQDGVPDLAIGTPFATVGNVIGVGRVDIRSGATGDLLYKIEGQQSGDFLGWAVASIGDLDLDGIPDLLVGAPNASPAGVSLAGSVEVRSGRTGSLLYRINGEEPAAYFGRSLAALGDIDGDGFDDFGVGAPAASAEGFPERGSAFVFSGATGALIYRFDGAGAFDEFGAAVAGGDIDGDGVPDIAIGSPSASPGGRVGAGSALVFSGASGQLIFQLDGETHGDTLGRSVAFVGDITGDGRSKVAIGAPYASPQSLDGAGCVYVLSY
jgi:hypothetical protein